VGQQIGNAFRAMDMHGDGLANTGALYHELKRRIAPELTPDQYKGLLQHLSDSKQVELKVWNEVRSMHPEHRALSIEKGDNVYGVVALGRGATVESIGKAAAEYMDKHGVKTQVEDFNPYGPGYDKHGNKLA
jgi:hypothetical protein